MFPSYNTNKLIYKAVLQGFFFLFIQSSLVFFFPPSGLQGPQTCAAAAATNSKTAVILLSRSKTRLRERLAFTFKNTEARSGRWDEALHLSSPVRDPFQM